MTGTPLDPDAFRDKPDEYLAWAADNFEVRPGAVFCLRHWMPCPVEGRNGIMATIMVMKAVTDSIPANVMRLGIGAMNAWIQKKPPCCQLGDDKVKEIWEQCPVRP